jgi:hypothetical protein
MKCQQYLPSYSELSKHSPKPGVPVIGILLFANRKSWAHFLHLYRGITSPKHQVSVHAVFSLGFVVKINRKELKHKSYLENKFKITDIKNYLRAGRVA